MIDFQKEIDRIVNNIVTKYDPIKIILFGSCAKGTQHELSDIDMVVIKDTNDYYYDRLKEVAKVADIDDVETDIVVYNPTEYDRLLSSNSNFFKEIKETGKVLYNKHF